MRKILYKAKRIDNEEWVEGSLVSDNENYFIISSFKIGYNDTFNPVIHKIIPETVSQYTGLKDKNGVKIFENDFLQFYYGEGSYDWQSYTVCCDIKYNGYSFYLKDYCNRIYKRSFDDFAIVGNIFDNPHLLNRVL